MSKVSLGFAQSPLSQSHIFIVEFLNSNTDLSTVFRSSQSVVHCLFSESYFVLKGICPKLPSNPQLKQVENKKKKR